ANQAVASEPAAIRTAMNKALRERVDGLTKTMTSGGPAMMPSRARDSQSCSWARRQGEAEVPPAARGVARRRDRGPAARVPPVGRRRQARHPPDGAGLLPAAAPFRRDSGPRSGRASEAAPRVEEGAARETLCARWNAGVPSARPKPAAPLAASMARRDRACAEARARTAVRCGVPSLVPTADRGVALALVRDARQAARAESR